MSQETLEVRVVGADEIRRLDESLQSLSRVLEAARADAGRLGTEVAGAQRSLSSLETSAKGAESKMEDLGKKGFAGVRTSAVGATNAIQGTANALGQATTQATALTAQTRQFGSVSPVLERYASAARLSTDEVQQLTRAVDRLNDEASSANRSLSIFGAGVGPQAQAVSTAMGQVTVSTQQAGDGFSFFGTAAATSLGDAANESENLFTQFGNQARSMAATARNTNASLAGALGISTTASAALVASIAGIGVVAVGAFALAANAASAFIEKTAEGKARIAPMTEAIESFQMTVGAAVVRSQAFQDAVDLVAGVTQLLTRVMMEGVESFNSVYNIVKNVLDLAFFPLIQGTKLLIEVIFILTDAGQALVGGISDLTDMMVDFRNFMVNQMIKAVNFLVSGLERLLGVSSDLVPEFELLERSTVRTYEATSRMAREFSGLPGVFNRITRALEGYNAAFRRNIQNMNDSPVVQYISNMEAARAATQSATGWLTEFFNQPTSENKPAAAMDAVRDAAERANAKVKDLAIEFQRVMALTALKIDRKKDPSTRFEGLKADELARRLRAEAGREEFNRLQFQDKVGNPTYLPPNFPLENPYLNTEGPKITGQRGAPTPFAPGYDPKTDPLAASVIAGQLAESLKFSFGEVLRQRISDEEMRYFGRRGNVAVAQREQDLADNTLQGEELYSARAAVANRPEVMGMYNANYFRGDQAEVDAAYREAMAEGRISLRQYSRFLGESIDNIDGLGEYLGNFTNRSRLAMFETLKEAETFQQRVINDFYELKPGKQENLKDQGTERIQASENLAMMSGEGIGLDVTPWVRSAEAVREYTEALKSMSQVQKDSIRLGINFTESFASATKAGLEAAASSSESFADTFRQAMGQTLISEGVAMGWSGAGELLKGNPIGAAQIALGAGMVLAGRAMGGASAGPAPSAAGASESVAQGQNTQIQVLNNFGFVGDRRAATREISSAIGETQRRRVNR
jgi:hypothetical protein